MTINKFIKYTSLLVLGLWMVATPGNSFATNEKVEKTVADFSNAKLSDGTTLTKGKQMKVAVEEYTKLRNQTKSEFEANQKEFDKLRDEVKELCRGTWKERTDKQMNESSEAIIDQWNKFSDAEKDKWKKTFNTNITTGEGFKSAVAAHLNSHWQGAKLVTTTAWEGVKGLWVAIGADTWLNDFKDTVTEFLADSLSPGFSYTYNAEAIIGKCTFGDRVPNEKYNRFKEVAAKAEQAKIALGYMPENIDSDATLMKYDVYVGLDENGDPKYITYYFLMSKDGTLKSISGVTAGCIPLPAKLAEAQSCIFCPLFKTIFNAAQSMATKSYAALASSMANVVLVAFSLLIAFKVLQNVSAFTKQDAPKFITELLVNMFKVLIAFYMLKSSTIVYDYIIGPVLKAGFEFGTNLLFARGNSYLESCKNTTQGVQMGVMPSYLYTNLDCFIKAVQAEVAVPQSIGSTLMCVARNIGKNNVGPISNVLWDFGMMFQGLAIWIMGWIMSLAFAFYLIDATIQLGIIGALMPFLIACWPFKVTQQYTKAGWSMFMNTFFVYVFMGLVISVNVELLGQSLTGSKGGFDAIMVALNGNEVKKLKDLLDIGFSGFLVFIACCLFAFKLTGQASDLAGTMGHSGGPKIGANVGGLAANVATRGVQGTAKLGLNAGKAFGDRTGITNVVNKGKDWLSDKAWGMVGLGRRSGKAGNKQARRSQMAAAAAGGAAMATAAGTETTPVSQNPGSSRNGGAATPTAQNQIKKMQSSGPRPTSPVTPNSQSPHSQSGTANSSSHEASRGGNDRTASQSQMPNQEELKQQLAANYDKTANGIAGKQMIQNQTTEVSRHQKIENDAQGKMNYHNRRANEYLQKAEKSTDPAQKQRFENLANEQFNDAVKAEAAYNQAKTDTQRAQAELNALKQENERYKNEYIQTEMNKRQTTQQ